MEMADPEAALQLLADSDRFPNIPGDLIRHAGHCLESDRPNRLTEELLRSPSLTTEALDAFFVKVSKIVNLKPDDLLDATDFSWRDMTPTRIESAIAELRAILFVDREGFEEIELLKAEGQKSADLTAVRGKDKFAIEVANSTYNARGRFAPGEMAEWIAAKYDEGDGEQLASTSSTHTCNRSALIGMINTQPTRALQVHRDFLEAATLAWQRLGSKPELHICMVTLSEALGYGPDDAVYPSW